MFHTFVLNTQALARRAPLASTSLHGEHLLELLRFNPHDAAGMASRRSPLASTSLPSDDLLELLRFNPHDAAGNYGLAEGSSGRTVVRLRDQRFSTPRWFLPCENLSFTTCKTLHLQTVPYGFDGLSQHSLVF